MWARVMAGHNTRAMAAMPAVVPSPSSQMTLGSDSTWATLVSRPMAWPAASRTAMSMTLLSTGAKAAAAKRRWAFEQGGGQGDQAVEQDLRGEQTQQQGGQALLVRRGRRGPA